MHRTFAPQKHLMAVAIATVFANGAALAQTAAPAEDSNAATVVVTGTRVANRTALDTAAPVDIISAETLKNSGSTEISQALSVALPSLNFPASRPDRRHRHRAPRHPARPGARPDPGAGQLQAPPQLGAGQRQRHHRPRLGLGRPEHDPDCRDRARHRGAARRRLGPVRLGRDRRRGQHPPAHGPQRAAKPPSPTAPASPTTTCSSDVAPAGAN